MDIPWEMIISRLEKVGMEVTEGVKTGAEFMWPLAIRQVLIQGVMWLVIGILFTYGIYKFAKWGKNKDLTETDTWGKTTNYSFVVYVISIFLGIINLGIYDYAIPRLFNTQWYAVQKLISMIK